MYSQHNHIANAAIEERRTLFLPVTLSSPRQPRHVHQHVQQHSLLLTTASSCNNRAASSAQPPPTSTDQKQPGAMGSTSPLAFTMERNDFVTATLSISRWPSRGKITTTSCCYALAFCIGRAGDNRSSHPWKRNTAMERADPPWFGIYLHRLEFTPCKLIIFIIHALVFGCEAGASSTSTGRPMASSAAKKAASRCTIVPAVPL